MFFVDLQQFMYNSLVNLLSPLRFRSQFPLHVEEECNINKACPSDQFCDFHVCRSCLHENSGCHFIGKGGIVGTCYQGLQCQYCRYITKWIMSLVGTFCQGLQCQYCQYITNWIMSLVGTCCQGFQCQYGRCTKGAKQGSPGTYCDKATDCDSNSCCVRELSINPKTSVCKPMLDEYESCGPINLFRQIYNGGKVEPACGPCKPGLQCKNVG